MPHLSPISLALTSPRAPPPFPPLSSHPYPPPTGTLPSTPRPSTFHAPHRLLREACRSFVRELYVFALSEWAYSQVSSK